MIGRIATLLCLAVCLFGPAAMAEQPLPEAEVKAAVVANLPLFVRWPSSAKVGDRPQVCTVAAAGLEAALKGQRVGAANGAAFDFRPVAALPDALRDCAMVFVGSGDQGTLFRVAAAVAGRPVLLVAEGSGVLQRGAMIGLAVQDGRVVVDVNLGALRRAGFDVSAKLLRLARTVVE